MKRSELVEPAIKAQLADELVKKESTHISMSSLGHCARQLSYRANGIEGAGLDWRSMMVFDDGHMHHDQLRGLIEAGLKKVNSSSCFKLTSQEKEVEYNGVLGHIDGMLEHSNLLCVNPDHHSMLLEVKSMNDRGFSELVKTETVGFEYACQVSGYLAALGLTEALILAKNKNTGEIAEFIYQRDDGMLQKRFDVIDKILEAKDAEEVEREYGPNKHGNLPWQCGYCPYVNLCWREHGITEIKPKKFKVELKDKS